MDSSAIDNPSGSELQAAETPTEPDIVISSREQIFYLLAEAAEIEHTLMCSYLYAVFSLKEGTQPDFSKAEAEAISRWRKMMMSIATEEMVHLLIVSNLTAAIGGRPHFTRPNFPVSPGYFPSGVVLNLTAFSQETIDHFIFLERPTGVEKKDGEGFITVEHDRQQAYQGLMPSAQDYATVSHLYEAIRTNLNAFVERSGENALFVGLSSGQIGPDIIRMPKVESILDLKSANRAIDVIIEQGEGSSADREDSHYRRFHLIKREYVELLTQNPKFQPAYPVAKNPMMRKPFDPVEKVFIDAMPAAMLLDFTNAVYGMLLRFLVQAYGPIPAQDKKRFLSAAIELMHIMAKAAKALVKLPANSEAANVNAGMTFTMLRSVEPFTGREAENVIVIERLQQLASGAKRIKGIQPEMVEIAEKLEMLMVNFL